MATDELKLKQSESAKLSKEATETLLKILEILNEEEL